MTTINKYYSKTARGYNLQASTSSLGNLVPDQQWADLGQTRGSRPPASVSSLRRLTSAWSWRRRGGAGSGAAAWRGPRCGAAAWWSAPAAASSRPPPPRPRQLSPCSVQPWPPVGGMGGQGPALHARDVAQVLGVETTAWKYFTLVTKIFLEVGHRIMNI